ncbi:sensor histidine kinase [Acuticoccus sediminis]|uniref:sensor histidine kinase n=1 Tax=Acuticoccus sediminis TaxID=2184697 RepID=UPI001CFE2659|nr:HAMP domain-containing sensor histidine kinase [Acuticoccus sediminis]
MRPSRSSSGHWLRLDRRLSLTTLLPVTIALAMFVVAFGSTQIGVHVLRLSEREALRDQAVVYLDAVAGAIASALPDDPARVSEAAAQLLVYRTALLEEAMAVRWTDPDGTAQTVVIGETDEAVLRANLDRVAGDGADVTRVDFNRRQSQAEATRTYDGPTGPFAITATFDARGVFEGTRRTEIVAVAVDIALAVFAALMTYVLTRRALRPLDHFIDRLADESPDGRSARRHGTELTRLEAALALRERSEAMRRQSLSVAAERERDAVLARLAATLAHEVRNPLAGLMNALSTLRRYGDDPEVRQRNVDLLARGLDSIGSIVDVTLAAYRRRSGRRRLTGREIRELDLLVATQARHADVTIRWDLRDEDAIETDADGLRQILLNLILNAIRAAPRGTAVTVSLSVSRAAGRSYVAVRDEGEGMSPAQIAALTGGVSETIEHERSIGIWLVANLVERIGAELAIESVPERGTSVTVIIPTASDSAAADAPAPGRAEG